MVWSILRRNFRAIYSRALRFCFLPFHGRRRIGLDGGRCCDGKTRRREILFDRLLGQLLFQCRRSISFVGQRGADGLRSADVQCSAELERRRHKVLHYADLQRWLVFIPNHRCVLAKKTVDQRYLARV